MLWLLRTAVAVACAAALVSASTAAAGITEIVAIGGGGVTSCTVEAKKLENPWRVWSVGVDSVEFYGRTDCTAPVEQTGHAWVPELDANDPPLDGGFCSGFRASCWSGGERTVDAGGYMKPMKYEITLVAPRDQGWFTEHKCEGVGSHQIHCVFSSDWVSGPVAT